MPREGIPSFVFIHRYLYLMLYFYSPHDMCFAWSVLYDLSLCFLVTTIILPVHTFWEGHAWIMNLLEYSMCFTYILWARQFALVLHLYIFRARWWLYFIEIVELSCFTYIILRVSLNSMVICFGYEFSPNMMGIQEGYNKNFHIKSIEYYEKFDSLHLFWDTKMVILESC